MNAYRHPYPFSAIVGQEDLKLALLVNAVSPEVGGVLVRGEKGTAKSTAVRALAGLLPGIRVVSGCPYSCDPDAPNPECPAGPHPADASAETRPVRLVELPVGASTDRLAGTLDIEKALSEGRKAFEPGLLAAAHRGILYVDEVNLLSDHLVDLLLDVAAMGVNYVEREGVSVRHPSRFILVGTMNPEEGELRPQLLDRFGVTVEVSGSPDTSDRVEVVRRSLSVEVDPALVPQPEAIEFPTAGGLTAHALYYPPTNPAAVGPPDERPPLLVNSHGGPTGQTPAMFSLATTFWTSRGFAVVYVNYGGSSGYGREYRRRLEGHWGVVDTQDCIAAARYLAERGSVDPDRLAIRGGSAGGYTTLCALTFHDDFAAGVSHFGVADPAALAAETHKFESRYLDGLIGPWPEAEERYRERSPIHHTHRLSCPTLLLQGMEDKVVPPSQAEAMAEALRANGIPHALLAFEGEQHGFRQGASIRRAYEAELAFYGRVFGFEPADDLPPLELVGG
jgi:acetyl esterase/lipase